MKRKLYIPTILIAMLLLAAYGLISTVSAKPLSNLEKTQQAVTASALTPTRTQTPYPSLVPTTTSSPIQQSTLVDTQVPTHAPNPTSTQIIIQPTAVDVTQPTAAPVTCDMVGFLGDVTVPDGTIFNPGDAFTKAWQLQNIGSCAWTSGSALVFVNGDLMGGQTVLPLPSTVKPGETINVSVNLIAPTTPGMYQGDWMLRDANGTLFGTTSAANTSFWVNIIVNAPPFAVTSVNETATPASYTGDCPVTIAIDANVTANGAGTVTYYWQRSDGSKSAVGTLTFTAAGSQTVEDGWAVTTPGTNLSAWDQIYIDQPNHQLFNPISFNVICNAPISTTQPTATSTPTVPIPTATQPAPTATPTQPAPTATSTQPAPTATPNQPAPTATPNQPAPIATPTQPAPIATPTRTH